MYSFSEDAKVNRAKSFATMQYFSNYILQKSLCLIYFVIYLKEFTTNIRSVSNLQAENINFNFKSSIKIFLYFCNFLFPLK